MEAERRSYPFNAIPISKVGASHQSFKLIRCNHEASKEGAGHCQNMCQGPVKVSKAVGLQLTAVALSYWLGKGQRECIKRLVNAKCCIILENTLSP